jgi:hypothetical protein
VCGGGLEATGRGRGGGGGAGGVGCGNDGAVISFKIIEEWLRERFNAYWYIDQNGDFRIEHISFFMSDFAHTDFGPQIDLAVLMSGCHSFAERKNKYEYQEDKLFDQEVWEWQHYIGIEDTAHDINFTGVPIYYGDIVDKKANCVPGEFKEKISSTPQLWTDAEWFIDLLNLAPPSPDTLLCDGFFMFDIYTTPTPDRVMIAVGALTALNIVNGHCSTANLQEYFFRWERIFLHGNMNNNDETFDSAIKIKLQDEIEYPNCCDEFDPMKTVTTEMGDGTVHSAVQTPYSVKIQLLYD